MTTTEQNQKEDFENEKEYHTTFEKGRDLETQFSIYMKRELGWTKVRVGAHMAGKANVKGANIDVIGERKNDQGRRFFNACLLFFTATIISFVAFILWPEDLEETPVIIAVFSALLSVFFYVKSESHEKENAWVECKNLKGKVNINQIEKSIREIKDYKSSSNTEYNFECHYFVSASGYIENALKFAIDNNIICYQLDGNTFKRVGYWD